LLEGRDVEQHTDALISLLDTESPAALGPLAPRLLELLKHPTFGRALEPSGQLRAHVVSAVLRAGYPYALSLDPDDLLELRREEGRLRSRRLDWLALKAVMVVALSVVAGLGVVWIRSTEDEPVRSSWESSGWREPHQPSVRALSEPDAFARWSALDEDLYRATSDEEIARAAFVALTLNEGQADATLATLTAAWERRNRETHDPRYLQLRNAAFRAIGSAPKMQRLRSSLVEMIPREPPEAPLQSLRNPTTLAAQAALVLESGEVQRAAQLSWACVEAFPEATRCLAVHIEAREGERLIPGAHWPEIEEARNALARLLARERVHAAR
jgi:hypothetical protein